MTTKVTVEPANHAIEIERVEGPHLTVTTDILQPGSAPREFWIHGNVVLSIREVAP